MSTAGTKGLVLDQASMGKAEQSPLQPFVEWFFPKLLPYIPRWVTPNAISYSGIALAITAGILMMFGGYSRWMYVIAAGLILLTWVTDTMDGIVARDRNKTSQLGYYLDHFGDSLAVVFIGLGIFWASGSHMLFAYATIVIYLLLHVNGHIKVIPFGKIELPAFGPTEIRLTIISCVFASAFIDYGQPLSWFAFTGNDGWLTNLLGFSTGLTFLDFMGLIVVSAFVVILPIEIGLTIRRLYKLDRENAAQAAKEQLRKAA